MESPVTFPCEGQQIVGMFHLPDDRPGPVPVVLFVHGFTGNRIEPFRVFVLTARRLAARGIASLRIDCRGSGDSEGDFQDMSITGEMQDVRTALAWLRQREEVDSDRIGLLGFSMGGMVSALVMSEDPGLGAVTLWSPVGEPQRQLAIRAYPEWEDDLTAEGHVATEAWKLGPAFIQEMSQLDPMAALRAQRAPVLLIHGDQDESVDVRSSDLYEAALQAAGCRVEKVIVAGADHTYTTVDWQETLQSTTVDWFAGNL